MIDIALVTRKLLLITTDLEALSPIASKTLETYLANPIDEVVAERYLERIIGRMIDINYHLLTESGQPPPPDYYQSFVQLGLLGALDPAFARRLASSAGLLEPDRARVRRDRSRESARGPADGAV